MSSSSIQTIPPKSLHSKPLAPFSAIAPPQYIQVTRLRLDTTLDAIIEEPLLMPSDELLEETSELMLEMAKCCYMMCYERKGLSFIRL